MRDRPNLLTILAFGPLVLAPAFSYSVSRSLIRSRLPRSSCSSTTRPALGPELVGAVLPVLKEVAHPHFDDDRRRPRDRFAREVAARAAVMNMAALSRQARRS
jgi:hypothetical protein